MTPPTPHSRRPRGRHSAAAGVLLLILLTGCTANPTGPPDSLPSPSQQVSNASCPDLAEEYQAALESTSTGMDHPGNYTVRASTEEALASELPEGVLNSIDLDCVVSAYSSAVESTQILGVALNPTPDEVASLRSGIAAAGWNLRPGEDGVFTGPEPGMAGVQTYEIDETTARQIGIPGPALVINAGRWDLWGAF